MGAGQHNILIEQGTDFSETVSVEDEDGLPIDLTGASGAAQLRKSYSSSVKVLDFDVSIVDPPTSGKLLMSIPKERTRKIPVEVATDFEKKTTKFVYDLELTDADGKTVRLLEGTAEVSPEVTR